MMSEPPVKKKRSNDMDQKQKDCDVMECGGFLGEVDPANMIDEELPVATSHCHTVLFQTPSHHSTSSKRDCWDAYHVRMPCSPQNLYPVEEGSGRKRLVKRWDLVVRALSQPISNSKQLEKAILEYNSKYRDRWDFTTLHQFFSEELSDAEKKHFFSSLLPQIISLALRLPSLVTQPVPLLTQRMRQSVSLSQLQVASLLANAFLCTFPWRNTNRRHAEFSSYPDINFNRLFEDYGTQCKYEKLKCIIHYFRKVCTKEPNGAITFTRLYIPTGELPKWFNSGRVLSKLDVRFNGTIEDDGKEMLQVDFANKYVGGGVLGRGSVQEEIRFVICPELIVARLFTEKLAPSEALLVTGCERYSRYQGYGESFEWAGDFEDKTPCDLSGRRRCSVVAMDAMISLEDPAVQYVPDSMMRELNKAYAAFYRPGRPSGSKLWPVATGNWGCGAFGGCPRLKALLQLMAASEAGRDVVYFTFGDEKLKQDLAAVYSLLVAQSTTVGELWGYLCRYYRSRMTKDFQHLYIFIQNIILPGDEKGASGCRVPRSPNLISMKPSNSKEKTVQQTAIRKPKAEQVKAVVSNTNAGSSNGVIEIQSLEDSVIECIEEWDSMSQVEGRTPQTVISGTTSDSMDAVSKEQKNEGGEHHPSLLECLEAVEHEAKQKCRQRKIEDYFK